VLYAVVVVVLRVLHFTSGLIGPGTSTIPLRLYQVQAGRRMHVLGKEPGFAFSTVVNFRKIIQPCKVMTILGTITKKILILLPIIAVAVILYSWQIEPNILSVKYVDMKNELLQKDCTVFFMADLHLPMRNGVEKRLFACLQNSKPDIILLGGDVAAYGTNSAFVIDKLKTISGYGKTVMVMGNTDGCGSRQCVYCSIKYPEDKSSKYPFTILRNETMLLPDFNIRIVGPDDPVTEQNDTAIYKEAMGSNFNILLIHCVYKLMEYQKDRFNLILSGHTHGGQVFFLRPFVHWFDYMVEAKYLNGVFPIKKGIMIVTKGVGESFLPVRLGVLPEVVLIRLKKGAE
jgi:uncharacterized protein